MVTWGTNTVSVFNNANSQQTSASTGGSLFGSTSTTSPAPATPGFSGFSSQPISSPSPGLGLFSPSSSGTTTSNSMYGAQQQQQQQSQYYAQAQAQAQASQILGAPQQAALQAHMNATAHQEASRLGSQLHQLYSAYIPFQPPQAQTQAQNNTNSNTTCRFQHIFYDPITQTQRLEKLSLPNYPPKPNHIPDATWYQALTQNPQPDEYIPVLVTSAEGLHSRLVAQQSKMKLQQNHQLVKNDSYKLPLILI